MANKKVAEPKRNKTERAYEYEQNYIKQNVKFVSVPFNMRNPKEKSAYDWLQRKKQEGTIRSIGGFIKDFLLSQMLKKGTGE